MSSALFKPDSRRLLARVGTDQSSAAIDEEVYDDVDSTSFPPLPPLSRWRPSLNQNASQHFTVTCISFQLLSFFLPFKYIPSMRLCTVSYFYPHSLPTFKGKNKSEDAELKRQKKMEKEEKEFRKKFKVCLSLSLSLSNIDSIENLAELKTS